MQPLRIALLSTCAVQVPPRAYGGTELIVAELAKQLTSLGHHVTVFATGDSSPGSALRYCYPRPVWPPNELAELRHVAFSWQAIRSEATPFDVVHAHQAPSLAVATLLDDAPPLVVTLHHPRACEFVDYYRHFSTASFVAISRRQAELVPELAPTIVHHGLDPAAYAEGDGRGDYCAFLGRLAPEKGPHVAIQVALEAGIPLRIGGRAHEATKAYFEREVRPLLSNSRIRWLGELSHQPKVRLLRGARALLFPIDWEEPFGLVMIEAMLVGTPVIAFARGSAGEVIEDGVTGFVVRDAGEMAARLKDIGAIDRRACRARAQERWSSRRMARDYELVYASMVENSRGKSSPALKTGS